MEEIYDHFNAVIETEYTLAAAHGYVGNYKFMIKIKPDNVVTALSLSNFVISPQIFMVVPVAHHQQPHTISTIATIMVPTLDSTTYWEEDSRILRQN